MKTPPEAATSRSESPARSNALAALRVHRFRVLFTAGVLTAVGLQAQVIARGWLANDLSESNTGLGGVFLAFGIAIVFATPFGGIAADRYPKRLILVVAQIALTLTAVWIGLAVTLGFVQYWMLLISAVIQGICLAFFAPSRMALNGEVVDRSLLMNAVVLSNVGLNLSRVLGPAMAGVFISVAWIGTAGAYYVAAVLAVLAAVAYIVLDVSTARSGRAADSVRADVVATLRFVRQNHQVAILLVASFAVTMFGFPFIAFLPRYATEILDVGAVGYGTLAAASAVGAVFVGWLVAGRATDSTAWRIQVIAGFAFSLSLVLMGLVDVFAAGVVAAVLVGGTSAGFQAMNNSLVLALTDLDHHGRVQSILMLSVGGFGIAALPLGALADEVGLGAMFVFMGLGVALSMVGYTLSSRWVRQRFGESRLA